MVIDYLIDRYYVSMYLGFVVELLRGEWGCMCSTIKFTIIVL
jgi:hypothetical protein